MLKAKGLFTYKANKNIDNKKNEVLNVKSNDVVDDDLDGESIYSEENKNKNNINENKENPNNTLNPSNILFIEKISDDISETLLINLFEKYGKIKKLRKMKNYAVVEYDTIESAVEAFKNTNGQMIKEGNRIKVSFGKN